MSLIIEFYSYIVVNNLWLALEWYITHTMVSTKELSKLLTLVSYG